MTDQEKYLLHKFRELDKAGKERLLEEIDLLIFLGYTKEGARILRFKRRQKDDLKTDRK